ncbi:MAG: hypothetical protein KBG15_00225 [Kofleriaceae bacterium]|nr:hypothetical protein [Kofleriaceae bacterium]
MQIFSRILFLAALVVGPSIALADEPVPPPTGNEGSDTPTAEGTPGKVASPTAPSSLPAPQSDDDVQPQVASPGMPAGGIVSQAGVGGVIGYGRAGVLELGGSAGFTVATDYRNLNFAPTIGWFVADNLELSGIVSVSNIKSGDASTTLWSTLIEPSYHLPINRSLFVFLGLGVGASHVTGAGTGFAVAPRIGTNFMIGRSGILSPSISYQYTTMDVPTSGGAGAVTTVALTSAVQFNVGYTVMW